MQHPYVMLGLPGCVRTTPEQWSFPHFQTTTFYNDLCFDGIFATIYVLYCNCIATYLFNLVALAIKPCELLTKRSEYAELIKLTLINYEQQKTAVFAVRCR